MTAPLTPAMRASVKVTSVRSRGPRGGAIFFGSTNSGAQFVTVVDHTLLPDASFIEKGQIWTVEGTVGQYEAPAGSNGFIRIERQIKATAITLERPSGKNIIAWIAGSPECTRIGEVKAGRLYAEFGPALVDHIEANNIGLLEPFVGLEAAEALCAAFAKHQIGKTLLWLDRLGINTKIAAKVAAFYGEHAQARIEKNPFLLLSFEAQWSTVDKIAQGRFGVAVDDTRRLDAAIEESLYRGMGLGHTCLPTAKLKEVLRGVLKSSTLVQKALEASHTADSFVITGDNFQTTGAYLMESYVAKRLLAMATSKDDEGQSELFTSTMVDAATVNTSIKKYESSNGFPLNAQQKEAVRVCASSRLSLILGGAGTGKTTVLKAVCQTLEAAQPGLVIYQLALAGRAAQRMSASTGRPSQTLAAFSAEKEIPGGSLIIVDEMSMVDIILMFRLLRQIPQGTRLILVGDPSQLPPIGPGLVLHALAGHPAIPQTELKVVERQSNASGIPQVAAAIRAHQEPVWAPHAVNGGVGLMGGISPHGDSPDGGKEKHPSDPGMEKHARSLSSSPLLETTAVSPHRVEGAGGLAGSGVSFVECSDKDLNAMVERIYVELGGDGSTYDVQILCTTKEKSGGVNPLNLVMHDKFHGQSQRVQTYNAEFGLVNALTAQHTHLSVGDLVMFTKNDYLLDLRNGSLGMISKALVPDDGEAVCCLADFEGKQFKLTSFHVSSLSHAFAITVHKSQGSQFIRVIVPIRANRMLDQALIYTAVTRGVDQVVFVGDKAAAVRAIKAPAFATLRHVALTSLLKHYSTAPMGTP